MKKNNLMLLIALLLACGIQAQTFWSVDFQTSENAPEGWTVVNHNTSQDGQWVFNNPDNRTFFSSKSGNGFAIIDSDYYGSGKYQNTDLLSPKVALDNHSNINISFDHHFKKSSGNGDTCRFSARVNNGEWTLIKMWESATAEETYQITLNDSLTWAEGDSVQLKFNYVGTYDWYWIVDNIRLYEPSAMVLSEATQTATSNDYGMIGGKLLMSDLQINTDGSLSPITTFNIYGNTGNTEQMSDVEKIMVYKGTNESVVNDETAKIAEMALSTTTFNIEVNTELELETHLYLVYQLSSTAVEGDSVDVAIDSLVANGVTVVPEVVNLPGMKYIRAGMQGTYVISAEASDNPNYASVSEAVTDLNEVGVQANVTFEIKPNTYEGFITIGEISGVDNDKTITFKGMGENPDATILSSNAGYLPKNTLKLDNAKFLRFENLTITSESSSYSTLVKLVNTYKDIRFKQVKFIGAEVTYSTYNNDKHLVYDDSDNAQDETLYFDDCDFVNGYIAIHVQGQGASDPYDRDVKIENSRFTGQYTKSVYLMFTENVVINHNHFENSKGLVNEFVNVDLYDVKDGLKIEGNSVIDTLENKGFTAIKCRPCIGTSDNPVLISNNMIKGSATSGSHMIDIKGNSSAYISVFNNTILMEGTGLLNGIFVQQKTEHLKIENNLMVNNTPNGFLMWIKNKNIEDKSVNYNILKSVSGRIGKYGTEYVDGLQAWRDSTSFGMNSDTLPSADIFVSDNNLHILSDENLRVANPLTSVLVDIDNETRSTTNPCAGADEFSSNTPPYLLVNFDTLQLDTFPQEKTLNLLHHFADAENDSITILLNAVSNEALLSAVIENDSILKVTRLANQDALSEWVELKAKSNGDSILTKVYVKMIAVDQAPEIQNQIEPQSFDTYPQTITVDITGAFTDPDNEDADMTYEIVSYSEYKYTATLDAMNLELLRNTHNAFANDTLRLKANSNGKSVEMAILVNAMAVVVEPLVSDFEEVELSEDSVWSAPHLNNNYFVDKTWRFYNFSEESYWGGFQVSSRKDTSKQALEAQYTAVTGMGYNGSEKYSVAYPNYYQTEVFPETGNATEVIKGMYVTNNLWTYQVIMNGDTYSTPFGGDSGDDEDYFRIKALAYDADGQVSDSLFFYLADYRFENNEEDYVVTDWKYFDLSPLGEVSKIRFSVEGTKSNEWGLVTPAYFCMDNFNGNAPDASPEVIHTDSVYLSASDTIKTLDLLTLVTDPDNEDSEIVFTIEGGYNNMVADCSIEDNILTVKRVGNEYGTTTLQLKALSNGLSVMFEVPVTVDKCSGIHLLDKEMLVCYPNPATDYIYFESPEPATYQVFSANGTMVKQGVIEEVGRNSIDVRSLKSGVYYVILKGQQWNRYQFIRQ